MKTIDRLLFRITDALPCRVIADGDEPYLERYYVGTLLGWRIVLHRFVASDPDKSLHDHPWQHALSFLLSGSYEEEYLVGMHTARRRVRWLNRLTGHSFHRVILAPGTHTWSLFCYRGRYKPWGFRRAALVDEYRPGKSKHTVIRCGKSESHLYQVYDYPGNSDDQALMRSGKPWWLACGNGFTRRMQGKAWPFPEPVPERMKYDATRSSTEDHDHRS